MEKTITKDLQIELLKKDVSFKDKQIDKLEERINKAIEYIGNGNLKITKRVRKKFISILKGSEE